jgi:hypothetical protein
METRRSFIAKTCGGLVAVSFPAFIGRAETNTAKTVESSAIFNPYEDVNWRRWKQIISVSHLHITSQEQLDKAYARMNIRHLPISNYYPSAPCYPAADALVGQHRPRQDFGVVCQGRFVDGPIDWNRVITAEKTGWVNELPEAKRKELPLRSGAKMFQTIPADLIISPNAEHHSFTNSPLHANSIGSLYASGTFDVDKSFLTAKHGYCAGTGLPWEKVFGKVLDQMLFPDAGGITINHPTWSKLTFPQVCQMLDVDARVLGIEVFNNTCALGYGDPNRGWAYQLWDDLLATGRRCFGLFTPDHAIGKGQNILLVPEFNERECLRAYRRGAFYGAIEGTGLQFSNITLAGRTLFVALNRRGVIRLASNKGESLKSKSVTEVEFKIPVGQDGRPAVSYLRAEAYDETNERLFSQPIMFGPAAKL